MSWLGRTWPGAAKGKCVLPLKQGGGVRALDAVLSLDVSLVTGGQMVPLSLCDRPVGTALRNEGVVPILASLVFPPHQLRVAEVHFPMGVSPPPSSQLTPFLGFSFTYRSITEL